MRELKLLERITDGCRGILGQKLTGIYLHGSLAFGCFRWESSDIDFLVVVNRPPDQEEKEAMIGLLLELDSLAPPKGLEMSVVTGSVCRPFVYPTPFELHFSNAHKRRACKDLAGYCRTMHGTDPDLAAHITVLSHVGRTLWGKPIPEVFDRVPRSAYFDSIRKDIENAPGAIGNDPVYYILNLCRVLAWAEENLVLSKEHGGVWGTEHLPESRELIQGALDAYRFGSGFQGDTESMTRFAEEILQRIDQTMRGGASC